MNTIALQTGGVSELLNALATVFGGWSQLPDSAVGAALLGNFTNGGLWLTTAHRGFTTDTEALDALCVASADIIKARWEDLPGFVDPLPEIRRGAGLE